MRLERIKPIQLVVLQIKSEAKEEKKEEMLRKSLLNSLPGPDRAIPQLVSAASIRKASTSNLMYQLPLVPSIFRAVT